MSQKILRAVTASVFLIFSATQVVAQDEPAPLDQNGAVLPGSPDAPPAEPVMTEPETEPADSDSEAPAVTQPKKGKRHHGRHSKAKKKGKKEKKAKKAKNSRHKNGHKKRRSR